MPDGFFIILVAARQTARDFFKLGTYLLLLKQRARRVVGLALYVSGASTPLEIVEPKKKFAAKTGRFGVDA